MEENKSKEYNPSKKISSEQIPDDTITVIIKCGGKTYMRGINMEATQEATAMLVGNVMQTVLDTVDMKGLKAGGGKHQ